MRLFGFDFESNKIVTPEEDKFSSFDISHLANLVKKQAEKKGKRKES
jgi:hypothetical protein